MSAPSWQMSWSKRTHPPPVFLSFSLFHPPSEPPPSCFPPPPSFSKEEVSLFKYFTEQAVGIPQQKMGRRELIGRNDTVSARLAELDGVVPEGGHSAGGEGEVARAWYRDFRQTDGGDVRE